MAVLDYVTGNTDRNPDNYLTGPDGEPIAIDHGYTFPSGTDDAILSDFVAAHLGRRLRPEVVEAVRALAPRAMRRMLRDTGLDDPAIDLAVARLEEIQRHEMITGEAWAGAIERAEPETDVFRRERGGAYDPLDLLHESRSYAGGREFVAPGDPRPTGTPRVAPRPGYYTLDIPADVAATLSPEHLAAILDADQYWRGEPVRLLADGFAQRLADLLGVEVIAPTDGADGPMGMFLPREVDRDGHWAAANGQVPDLEHVSATNRRVHILYSDANGKDGGHRHDSGIPYKTTFPESWDDDKIIDEIEHVAKNPDVPPTYDEEWASWKVTGHRDGVDICVYVEPGGMIRTGFPTGGEGVHRNDEDGEPQPLEGT